MGGKNRGAPMRMRSRPSPTPALTPGRRRQRFAEACGQWRSTCNQAQSRNTTESNQQHATTTTHNHQQSTKSKQRQTKASNQKQYEATINKQQCATRKPTRSNQQNASDVAEGRCNLETPCLPMLRAIRLKCGQLLRTADWQ